MKVAGGPPEGRRRPLPASGFPWSKVWTIVRHTVLKNVRLTRLLHPLVVGMRQAGLECPVEGKETSINSRSMLLYR